LPSENAQVSDLLDARSNQVKENKKDNANKNTLALGVFSLSGTIRRKKNVGTGVPSAGPEKTARTFTT